MKKCGNCGIPTRAPGLYCDVCESMLAAVERPFFIAAHQEYCSENMQRVQIKKRLLNDNDVENPK